jgi:hypothetical protein
MNSGGKPKTALLSNDTIKTVLLRSFMLFDKPKAAAFIAGITYLLIASAFDIPWRLSSHPYYNYLADAFLHGQLHLRLVPPETLDLVYFKNQYYLYWGPLPAALALPFVALFGVGFSDVLQTIVIGSINAGLFSLFLHKAGQYGLIELSPYQRSMMVIFFIMGTSHTPLPSRGHVWEMSNLITLLLTFLAFIFALSLKNARTFFMTGIAISGIILTRPSGMFVAVFLAWYLLHSHWKQGINRLLQYSILGLIPVLTAIGVILFYNYLRFGDSLDNGMHYMLQNPNFMELYSQFGFFHPTFIPINFYITYLYYPIDFFNQVVYAWGGSIFFLSPLFFASFFAFSQTKEMHLIWALIGSIILSNIPILMLLAPGTLQFGSRYSLDFIVPLLLLTAIGIRRFPNWLIAILVLISVIHYMTGAMMMTYAWR